MSYKVKPLLKIYEYTDKFTLLVVIDDYMACSWQRSKYAAGQFTVEINLNIPNSKIFDKNLFIHFGDDVKDFGVITTITDTIGPDGKGSQIRSISGYDCRYLLKRRIISDLNANGLFSFTGKGSDCIRELVETQCGIRSLEKRRLPITVESNSIGKEFTIQEAYTNLYDVCTTIATQTDVMWYMAFEYGTLKLKFAVGEDLSRIVRFDVDYESLKDGTFTESTETYANVVYIGGQGNNDSKDIYEGEANLFDGHLKIDSKDFLLLGRNSRLFLGRESPNGMNRFEAWNDQSTMTTLEEYRNSAESVLNQFAQTTDVQGNGLPKSPYKYKENYNVGDFITIAFSGKSAKVQILSVTENWAYNQYNFQFEFGKPINDLSKQLSVMLSKIQFMQANAQSKTTNSVRWYTIPTETEMTKAEITYNLIGFVGDVGSGATFKLYQEENTGAKTYHVYIKQVAGSGKITLTTGKIGASNLQLDSGTYVTIIYVDDNGNVIRII